MVQTDTTGQLSWLLDNLVDQVEHVQQALILSRDGLVVAASRGLSPEDSEHLSVLAAGRGTCLAVLTGADANVGLIAYEMAMLVRRMGKYLATESRFPDQEIAAE